MISSKKIKEITEKEGKKIGADAISLLNKLLEKESEKIIKKAARNADFSGRKVIRKEDVEKNIT